MDLSERVAVRVLGLGNEILADDGFGILVARQLAGRSIAAEVVCCSESGLALLDHLVGAGHVVVVDTLPTGGAEPGTLYVLGEGDLKSAPGGSPHFLGLLETLALGRRLGLPVAERVTIIAVEPADCLTVGGPMHPAVEAAIPRAVELAAGCC